LVWSFVESGGWLWLFSDAGVSEHVARKKVKTTLLFFVEMMSALFWTDMGSRSFTKGCL